MRIRRISACVVALVLTTAVESLGQARCTDQNPKFSGVDLRFEKSFKEFGHPDDTPSNREKFQGRSFDQSQGNNRADLGFSAFSFPNDADAYLAASFGLTFLVADNDLEGATDDLLWIGFEPMLEAWSARLFEWRGPKLRFGAGAGPSFNFIRRIGSDITETLYRNGVTWRVTARLELNKKIAVDFGYQWQVLLKSLRPSDYGGPAGEPFDHLMEGPTLSLRIG